MLGNSILGSGYLGGVGVGGATATASKTLDEVLDSGRVKPFFLAEIFVAKYLPLWFLHSGSVWKITETDRVTGLTVNGEALAQKNSVAEVTATPGSWYWDRSEVYLQLSNSSDPNEPDSVVNALLTFYFASEGLSLNGLYWDGRIKALPGTSIRIERKAGSLSQISGGKIQLLNNDGFFDSRFGYQWDAGATTLRMGADGVTFTNYKKLGTFLNESKEKTDGMFTLGITERKDRARKTVPVTYYSRDDYPNLDEEDAGSPIQIAYGTILGARPTVINRGTRTFKVAGHQIAGFDGVKVKTDETWNTVGFTSTDLVNAEFTLDSADWDGDQEVSVDFRGKVLASTGELMTNASDIVKDLLQTVGETDIDSPSFTTSKDELEIGYIFQNSDKRVDARTPSLYLNEETKLLDAIEKINTVVGAFLTSTADGDYSWQVFTPIPGARTVKLDDSQISNFKVNVDAEREVSRVIVKYGERLQEDRRQSVTVDRNKNQYNRNEGSAVVESLELNTTDTDVAKQVAQRILTLGEHQSISYSFNVKWGAFTLTAGDQIHLVYDRHGIDAVLDVLSWKPTIGDQSYVSLTVGNLRGFANKTGFWEATGATTPAGASMDWSSSERPYKRQNSGHWHSSQDFALSSPADTDDYQTSTWIG